MMMMMRWWWCWDDDDDDDDVDDDVDDDGDDDDIFLLLLAHPTPDTAKSTHPPASLSDVGRKTNRGKHGEIDLNCKNAAPVQ